MAPEYPCGKRKGQLEVFGVPRIDFLKRTEARARVVLRRHGPIAIIGLGACPCGKNKGQSSATSSEKRFHFKREAAEWPPFRLGEAVRTVR
jgi:hypothetical protein